MDNLKQRKQIERSNSATKFFFLGVSFVSTFIGAVYFGII